jgi:hypothetical protein
MYSEVLFPPSGPLSASPWFNLKKQASFKSCTHNAEGAQIIKQQEKVQLINFFKLNFPLYAMALTRIPKMFQSHLNTKSVVIQHQWNAQ